MWDGKRGLEAGGGCKLGRGLRASQQARCLQQSNWADLLGSKHDRGSLKICSNVTGLLLHNSVLFLSLNNRCVNVYFLLFKKLCCSHILDQTLSTSKNSWLARCDQTCFCFFLKKEFLVYKMGQGDFWHCHQFLSIFMIVCSIGFSLNELFADFNVCQLFWITY